jgi:integrase
MSAQALPSKQRDLLMLLALTGLRRNEGGMLRKKQVDIVAGVLLIPDTKTGQAHSLPITPMMHDILVRRCDGLAEDDPLFSDVSFEHLAEMAMRAGAPKFMLHDLRKLLATTGEQLGFSDTVLRRILNHKAKRSDTLHRHYVRLAVADIHDPLVAIQERLLEQMRQP